MILKLRFERVLLLLDCRVDTRMVPGLRSGATLRENSSGMRMFERMAETALPWAFPPLRLRALQAFLPEESFP